MHMHANGCKSSNHTLSTYTVRSRAPCEQVGGSIELHTQQHCVTSVRAHHITRCENRGESPSNLCKRWSVTRVARPAVLHHCDKRRVLLQHARSWHSGHCFRPPGCSRPVGWVHVARCAMYVWLYLGLHAQQAANCQARMPVVVVGLSVSPKRRTRMTRVEYVDGRWPRTSMAEKSVLTQRTMHYGVRLAFIRQQAKECNRIVWRHVPTTEQIADVLTKSLANKLQSRHTDKLLRRTFIQHVNSLTRKCRPTRRR